VTRPVAAEAEAYRLLEQLRWNGAPATCPHCGAAGRCRYLRPRDGLSRATRTGARSPRRIWKCGACDRQFSVLTGTVFEGTRIALGVWVDVVATWSEGGPVTAPELVDRYGLSRESAEHVVRRLSVAIDRIGPESGQPGVASHG
jgi:transposase-like protein